MKVKSKLALSGAAAVAVFYFGQTVSAQTLSEQSIPDISEFQNTLTTATAKRLKGESGGVILRTGYGENRKDYHIDGNLRAAKSAGLAYGVYQFGQYINAKDARSEARATYYRAPHAKFYINDAETYTTTSGSYAAAVRAWAQEMRKLTKKPIVIYSYRGFYNSYIKSDKGYDAKWIAAYQKPMPTPRDYAMWQYTNAHYSLALKQSTDASKIVTSKHSMAWWFGSTVNKSKFTVGGFKIGDKVRLKSGVTYYGTKTKAGSSLAKTTLTVKSIRTVYTGKSSQVLTVYHGSKVIGQVRAQDVTKVKSATKKVSKKTAKKVAKKSTKASTQSYMQHGVFYPNTTLNVRTGAGTNYRVVAAYFRGESVIYDKVIIKHDYVWARYVRANGHYGYIALGVNGGQAYGSRYVY